MSYTIVNVLTVLVGLTFLFNGVRLIRQGREDVAVFVVSLVIGIGLVFVSVFPNSFSYVAETLGLELKARAILIVSNLTLFVLVTYLFSKIGKLHRNISTLNEELTLLRASVGESAENDDPPGDD